MTRFDLRSGAAILVLVLVLALGLAACNSTAVLPPGSGIGPNPTLPAPRKQAIPTVKVAPAIGWPAGRTPTAAAGLTVAAFAQGLEHPRWLYVLPNGDVLVAETNGPKEPLKGIKGWAQGLIMKNAGAEVKAPNRISLLRDADGDGVVETRTVFIDNLASPFGMTLVGNDLYVANTDAVLKFAYAPGATAITTPGVKLIDLPGGPIDHHWTKNIIASLDGSKLYVTVGSNSNVGENGMENEVGRAAIWEVDRASGKSRIFASGLRNPNGMGWQPVSGALWVAVNERDEIGDDLVPDYITSVKDGGFYGWPYSYYGQHVDVRIQPQRPDLVAKAIAPDYATGPHTATLGLTFYTAALLPPAYRGGAFLGQHGSWNRSQFNGYKVIYVPFAGGKPSGPPSDVLTGFVDSNGKARGRPVGVVVDKPGALLVADDVGNTVWRVTAS
ncbi:sorbosone dehydrogenase family protein [soil metagenome]